MTFCGIPITPLVLGTILFCLVASFLSYPACADALDKPILRGLGNRLEIRVAADTVEGLYEKTQPDLVWGTGDMLWIEDTQNNPPRFVVDRPFQFRHPDGRTQWVLLARKEGSFDEWYGALSGQYLRAEYEPVPDTPPSVHKGGYARILDKANGMTLYEVAWSGVGEFGTSNASSRRLLYLLQTTEGRWLFFGEGPTECAGRSGGSKSYETRLNARPVWTPGSQLPVRMHFVMERNTHITLEGEQPRDEAVTLLSDYELSGRLLPASLRRLTEHDYFNTREGDTLTILAGRLCLAYGSGGDEDSERRASATKRLLLKLNPDAGDAVLEAGTHIWVPSYPELVEAWGRFASKSGN